MYEIATETIQLSEGDGVDQVCQLLVQLAEDPRPMEKVVILPDRVEVSRMVDPEEEMLRLEEGPPSSVESMLGQVEMEELPFDKDMDVDALRLVYRMCVALRREAAPICWVVGDLDQLGLGLGQSMVPLDGNPQLATLFGLPVKVTAHLGHDRMVLVGGASRYHNPMRATRAISAFMPWAERG
jgi:hypothetical protein